MAAPANDYNPLSGNTNSGANDYNPGSLAAGKATGLNYDPFAGITSSFGALNTIGGNLTRATFWQRIGVGLLGLLLIWWAILFALASNKTVQGAVKTALKSNPETAIPATIAETAIGN